MEKEIIEIIKEHIARPNIEECVSKLRELKKTDIDKFRKSFLNSDEIIRLVSADDDKLAKEVLVVAEEQRNKRLRDKL